MEPFTLLQVGVCASCGKGHRDVEIILLDKSDQESDILGGSSVVKIGSFTCKTTNHAVDIYQVNTYS